MSKPLAEELTEFETTLDLYRKQYAEDGTISADEQTQLDVLEGKIKRLLSVAGSSNAGNGNGLGGWDTGQVQADTAKEIKETLVDVLKLVTKEGLTTIIIENHTSKVLSRIDGSDKLKKPEEAEWVRKAAPDIAAAKDGKPSIETISVKTDMRIRGVTRAYTSGEVMYEFDVPTRNKSVPLLMRWGRKGDKEFAEIHSWVDHPLFDIRGHQSKEGEFTFKLKEKAPATKPQAPPADTYVLFEYNDSKLTSKARSQLNDFAVAYRAAKSTAEIKVEGWASIDGKEAKNEKLSYDRAEEVYIYLVDKDKGGLSKDSVKWEGKKVTSDFDSDKKKLEPNRRVTIKLK